MTEHNHAAPLGDLAGEMGAAYAAFDAAVFTGTGEIPRKYRELIALGVAMTTQCDHCLKVHARTAVEFGATDEELAETTYITAALRAGGGIVHGAKALGSIKRSGTA